MPNFLAREREKAEPSKERKEPDPIRDPLPKVSDGTACNVYYHRDRFASVEEVSTPGYFNFMRDTFRSGAQKGVVHLVTCHLGEVADGLTTVDLHLVEAPTMFSGPVIMAVGSVAKFTAPAGVKKPN